jgi:hypothetical protein
LSLKFSGVMKDARMLFHVGQVGVAVVFLAAGRDDAGRARQVAVQVGHVQRRQQLAHCQVAHAAEDNHVEGKAGIRFCREGHVVFIPRVDEGAGPATSIR